MSKDIAQSDSSPLLAELFTAVIYKPNQGRIVRQMTALAVWLIVGLGCWRLYATIAGSAQDGSMAAPGIAGGLLAAGLWFGFRVVNWPRFADFLIAVEAEMNKVTWPSKDELVRASIVVIFTIFFLAVILFTFDIVWQTFFTSIGIKS